jgi:hypothetical protein
MLNAVAKDLFFVLITVLFFVIAWAYVRGCDRL